MVKIMDTVAFRIEKDSFGELNVPADAYYGVHTVRSLQNFQISTLRWHKELIVAIAQLKAACCSANEELELLENKKADAIRQACAEIIDGKFSEQFPLDIFQAGSGTSTNMNVNEVIANRAVEILGGAKGSKGMVHPNDDVNKGQSTNNIIPSAIRVACCTMLPQLIAKLTSVKDELAHKAEEFSNILKSARTHLQDAVPIRLGQEFGAYATALGKHIERLEETKKFLYELGVGGNAVGTGINTPPEFRAAIIKQLNELTNMDFKVTRDGIESTQFLTDIAALSSLLKLIAIDLNKISGDLRLMSSGPKTGLHEIMLPAVEPGSSIMPGKINPSIAEAVTMACFRVMGNDTAISVACTSGTLDLNTTMPLIGYCIIESLEILTNAASTFAEKCIAGITADKEQCRYYVEHSMALATAFNPHLGYDKVAELVKESLASGTPIQQLAIQNGYFTKEQADTILNPRNLTRPNLSSKSKI